MVIPKAFHTCDATEMRRTMGRFLTGAAVVTARDEEETVGMTINSLTSISLDPPILMISLNYGTRTGDGIVATGRFAVSILGIKQEAVARQFAVRGGTRFETGEFDTTPSGLPVIAESLAQAECEVYETYHIGDHQVFFGTVVHSRYRDGDPLAFNTGRFGSFNDFNHDPAPWFF